MGREFLMIKEESRSSPAQHTDCACDERGRVAPSTQPDPLTAHVGGVPTQLSFGKLRMMDRQRA